VELLDAALVLARQLGYRVREEWLDGRGGGGCEIRGQKWIFLDLALSAEEQLEAVLDTLRADPATVTDVMDDRLRRLLRTRKIA
jgi:hypothetical protein